MSFREKFNAFIRKYFVNPKWRCLACGKEIFDSKEYFCTECKDNLPFNDKAICDHCGRKVLTFEDYCSTCKGVLVSLDKCRSVFNYEMPINMLIKRLKYDNARYLKDYFIEQLYLVYLKHYFNADIITCVPMTAKAFKKRGYNQSQLLAVGLAEKVNVAYMDLLEKTKETVRQVKLGRTDRLKNFLDVFKVKDKKLVKDKSVLIVDDVSTTGATGQAIAEKLKKAGAKQVFLLTVASVPPIQKY